MPAYYDASRCAAHRAISQFRSSVLASTGISLSLTGARGMTFLRFDFDFGRVISGGDAVTGHGFDDAMIYVSDARAAFNFWRLSLLLFV